MTVRKEIVNTVATMLAWVTNTVGRCRLTACIAASIIEQCAIVIILRKWLGGHVSYLQLYHRYQYTLPLDLIGVSYCLYFLSKIPPCTNESLNTIFKRDVCIMIKERMWLRTIMYITSNYNSAHESSYNLYTLTRMRWLVYDILCNMLTCVMCFSTQSTRCRSSSHSAQLCQTIRHGEWWCVCVCEAHAYI